MPGGLIPRIRPRLEQILVAQSERIAQLRPGPGEGVQPDDHTSVVEPVPEHEAVEQLRERGVLRRRLCCGMASEGQCNGERGEQLGSS